jgi:hypothetical protein
MSASLLPVIGQGDQRKFKMVLEGVYKLRVVRVSDISKPNAKPVADIDEPENEDEANEIKLDRNNTRMIQLCLRDTNNTEINALEEERIPELDDVSVNSNIYIEGPVEVRCGNMMLSKRHVIGKEFVGKEQVAQKPVIRDPNPRQAAANAPVREEQIVSEERVIRDFEIIDDDDDDDDCIIIE